MQKLKTTEPVSTFITPQISADQCIVQYAATKLDRMYRKTSRCDITAATGRGGSDHQTAQRQGDEVGVVDLGVLHCYLEMSDAAGG